VRLAGRCVRGDFPTVADLIADLIAAMERLIVA
jgi:hypothetical protein